jgi:hypothetical protein
MAPLSRDPPTPTSSTPDQSHSLLHHTTNTPVHGNYRLVDFALDSTSPDAVSYPLLIVDYTITLPSATSSNVVPRIFRLGKA